MLTASYVGNHGYDLQETVNANMYASVHQHHELRRRLRRLAVGAPPTPRFVTVTQYYNNGVSNYNCLTLQYRHTFSYGLPAQIHYTWSHALGDTSTSTAIVIQSVQPQQCLRQPRLRQPAPGGRRYAVEPALQDIRTGS